MQGGGRCNNATLFQSSIAVTHFYNILNILLGSWPGSDVCETLSLGSILVSPSLGYEFVLILASSMFKSGA